VEDETKLTTWNSDLGFANLAKRCSDLAGKLNSVDTYHVDSSFVGWTDRYTSLLWDMSECCHVVANHETREYQARRLLEVFIRAEKGDPFSVPLEEASDAEQARLLVKTFELRRMKLLYEFQRKYNAISPEDKIKVGK
jgi:hypothetical protein